MPTPRDLPPDFLAQIRALEPAYLAESDPILQSGFHGGPERWRAERGPILDPVTEDGDLLDAGSANGYLLECLVAWGAERGLRLTPFGVDIGPRLVDAAKRRLPAFATNFWTANVWDWRPPRRFKYVYALYDCVPIEMLREYVEHLLDAVVEPGGRLIVGAYGSASRGDAPLPIADVLASYGQNVAGRSFGGRMPDGGPVTAFAWVDNIR